MFKFSTVGESKHDISRLKSVQQEQESDYDSGLFLLQDPIPFDGTIVDVTASGYCTIAGKENEQFQLLLTFYDGKRRVGGYVIPAECETHTNNSNVTVIGRVQQHTEISVTTDQCLGIQFRSQCNRETDTCTFRPATDTDMNKQQQFFYLQNHFSSLPDLDTIMTSETVGLQFSFTIEGGKSWCALILFYSSLHTNAVECENQNLPYLAVLLIIPLLVITILVFLLLHKYYKSRKKMGKVLNHFSSMSQENMV